MAPSNLQRLFENTSRKHNLLRKSDISLELPKPRTEAMKRSFQYRGHYFGICYPQMYAKSMTCRLSKRIKEAHSEKCITIL